MYFHIAASFVFLSPVWSLSVKNESLTGLEERLICIQHPDNTSSKSNPTWKLYASDEFALAKIVRLLHSHVALAPSPHSCQLKNICSQRNIPLHNRSLPLNCPHLKQKPDAFHQILKSTVPTKQLAFGEFGLDEYNTKILMRNIVLTLFFEKWTNYIILCSGAEELTALSSQIPNPSSKVLLTLRENVKTSLTNVYKLMQEKDLNFIMMCTVSCILNVLHQVHLLEMDILKRSRWLIVYAEGINDNCIQTEFPVKTADVLFMKVQSTIHQTSNYHALLKFADTFHSQSLEEAKDETIHSANRTSKMKKALYNITLRNVGYVDETDVQLAEELYPGLKYDLNKRTFTAAILPWPPFVFKEGNGTCSYWGISLDLLNELAQRFNFSYKCVEPEDQEWGRMLDGKWTGLVRLILEKKADLVIAPIATAESREAVMDFTTPYYFVQSAVVIKKPDINHYKWRTLLSPFRLEVHICILLSLLFSIVVLFVVEEVNPANIWTDNRISARRRRFGDIFWYHLGALTANDMSGTYLPLTIPGRSVLVCWWLFTVMSSAIYSGNLIAFLTDWQEKLPFSTISEMVEQNTYRWGTVGGSNYVSLFQNSNRSEYRKIWQGLQKSKYEDPDVLSINTETHLPKVLAGQYAYIGDVAVLELWKSKYCDLVMLQEEFLMMTYSIGLPQNSSYKNLFSAEISKIYESGLVDMWYKKWMPRSRCDTSRSAKRVDLLALQSAFYAAGAGILMAVLFLLAEALYIRIGTTHSNRHN